MTPITRKVALAAVLACVAMPAVAWDGTIQETGDSVEIERGNLVRSGEDIEVFDYGKGTYRNLTVESIQRYGSSVEIEVYDNNTGEVMTLDMDD